MKEEEYKELVHKEYLERFSKNMIDTAERYFKTDDAQEVVKKKYKSYSKYLELGENAPRGSAAANPSAVGYCLYMMCDY